MNIKKVFLKMTAAAALSLLILTALPITRFAQAATDGGVGSADPKSSGFQLVSCTGVVDPRPGHEPGVECDYNQLVATASRILQYAFYILAPMMVGMILFVGFNYMRAGGDPVKLEKAKSMIKPLLIGLILMSAAYVIVYKFILGNLLVGPIGGLSKTAIINTGGNK